MNVAPFQEQEVEWIIHHVVLPPRLPQSAEEAEVTACAKKALLGSVASLSQLYLQQAPTRFKASWRARQRMLSTWAHLQPSAPMSKRLFTKSVTGLRAGGQSAQPILQCSRLTSIRLNPDPDQGTECRSHLSTH